MGSQAHSSLRCCHLLCDTESHLPSCTLYPSNPGHHLLIFTSAVSEPAHPPDPASIPYGPRETPAPGLTLFPASSMHPSRESSCRRHALGPLLWLPVSVSAWPFALGQILPWQLSFLQPPEAVLPRAVPSPVGPYPLPLLRPLPLFLSWYVYTGMEAGGQHRSGPLVEALVSHWNLGLDG